VLYRLATAWLIACESDIILIRIPYTIMEQCGFGDSIEMEIKNGSLVLIL
jgi:hypothetical protein